MTIYDEETEFMSLHAGNVLRRIRELASSPVLLIPNKLGLAEGIVQVEILIAFMDAKLTEEFPEQAEVQAWKQTFLATFDAHRLEEWDNEPGFGGDKRQSIERLFDRLTLLLWDGHDREMLFRELLSEAWVVADLLRKWLDEIGETRLGFAMEILDGYLRRDNFDRTIANVMSCIIFSDQHEPSDHPVVQVAEEFIGFASDFFEFVKGGSIPDLTPSKEECEAKLASYRSRLVAFEETNVENP